MAYRTFTHDGVKYIVNYNDLIDGIFIMNEINQMELVEAPSEEVQSKADELTSEMEAEFPKP